MIGILIAAGGLLISSSAHVPPLLGLLPFLPPVPLVATLLLIDWFAKEIAHERYPCFFEFKDALKNYETDLWLVQAAFWRSLAPAQFEAAVASLLDARDCRARLTGGSGDGGVDVELADGTFIQCKATATQIGPAILRELLGTKTARGAPRAVCVSRAGFTRAAQEFAARYGVEVWGVEELVRLQQGKLDERAPKPPIEGSAIKSLTIFQATKRFAKEQRTSRSDNYSADWRDVDQGVVRTIGKYTIESSGAVPRSTAKPPSSKLPL